MWCWPWPQIPIVHRAAWKHSSGVASLRGRRPAGGGLQAGSGALEALLMKPPSHQPRMQAQAGHTARCMLEGGEVEHSKQPNSVIQAVSVPSDPRAQRTGVVQAHICTDTHTSLCTSQAGLFSRAPQDLPSQTLFIVFIDQVLSISFRIP